VPVAAPQCRCRRWLPALPFASSRRTPTGPSHRPRRRHLDQVGQALARASIVSPAAPGARNAFRSHLRWQGWLPASTHHLASIGPRPGCSAVITAVRSAADSPSGGFAASSCRRRCRPTLPEPACRQDAAPGTPGRARGTSASACRLGRQRGPASEGSATRRAWPILPRDSASRSAPASGTKRGNKTDAPSASVAGASPTVGR
jgi:hypothetical protein